MRGAGRRVQRRYQQDRGARRAGGGQGRGRTADLPIFSRTLVPTELPGRVHPRGEARAHSTRAESTVRTPGRLPPRVTDYREPMAQDVDIRQRISELVSTERAL